MKGRNMPEPPIVVTGTRLKINKDSNGGGWLGYLEQGYDGEPNPTLSPESSGSGGPYEEMPAAKQTPCVTASPEGYSLEEINNVALYLTGLIRAGRDGLWEYGAVIYAENGVIRFTGVVTQQNPDQVDYPFSQVPDGAVILAVIHNHPEVPTIDDRYPGAKDWNTYRQLVQANSPLLSRRITADPKMLMYVFSNQDWKTRVYDKNDMDSTAPQCSLQ
jgi:hypothetical protein